MKLQSKKYDSIDVIRYMGSKKKLLSFIIPVIEEVAGEGETVCDLLAGTHCIGYALKKRNRIIGNDIQQYSHVIGKAIVENKTRSISRGDAGEELREHYHFNKKKRLFSFFRDHYTGTYFSGEQCFDIDSIRYALGQTDDEYRQALYLCALMSAMCQAQSSPGHFAQFMPGDHARILPLRALNIWQLFLDKCDNFSCIVQNDFQNLSYCMDMKDFLQTQREDISCFYVDPPYSGEQYSRFYHLLETVTRYDKPELKYKARYRMDRFKSGFCYRDTVQEEFAQVMAQVRLRGSTLVISYSENGLLPVEEIGRLGKRYFKKMKLYRRAHAHSTLGKGNSKVNEVLFVFQ